MMPEIVMWNMWWEWVQHVDGELDSDHGEEAVNFETEDTNEVAYRAVSYVMTNITGFDHKYDSEWLEENCDVYNDKDFLHVVHINTDDLPDKTKLKIDLRRRDA